MTAGACTLLLATSASGAPGRSGDPKQMVLRLSDLPTGFGHEAGYYASNVRASKETSGVTVADFIRWGRITGYDSTFQRNAIAGLIEVDSLASIYKTRSGTRKSLLSSYRFAEASHKLKRLSLNRTVGEEARLYSYTTKQSGITAVIYVVSWRYKTVKASLVTGGISGTVPPETAVGLARKQQRHIAVAVG